MPTVWPSICHRPKSAGNTNTRRCRGDGSGTASANHGNSTCTENELVAKANRQAVALTDLSINFFERRNFVEHFDDTVLQDGGHTIFDGGLFNAIGSGC